jgi:alpha-N-arabinofuranosidase
MKNNEFIQKKFCTVIFSIQLCIVLTISNLSPLYSLNTKRTVDSINSVCFDTLLVDCSIIVNNTERKQIGINTCILTDDDQCYFRKPVRPYDEAIKELGVKYLRYPGGYKSDIIFWSTSPYHHPDPSLVYRSSNSWPGNDTLFVNKDGTWRVDLYDFDEFMTTCKNTGTEPVIVVTYNSLRWPGPEGDQPPSKLQIIENACQWVRYANVEKKYNVKYWEIGNESWLTSDDGAVRIAPEIYGSDVLEIAQAMKSVDPNIQIGANGDKEEYWTTVLDIAAPVIDFLSVHSYPLYGFKNYTDYLRNDIDATSVLEGAKKSILANPVAAEKGMKIMMTEFAAGVFDQWDRELANMARAVITFDIQGQLLQDPDCYFSQFWNTINAYDKDNSVFNALWHDNSLTSLGMALSIWGTYLEDEMLKTQSTSYVKCFATKTDGKFLTIFALNKDTLQHNIVLEIKNLDHDLGVGELWLFNGTTPTDVKPIFYKQRDIGQAEKRDFLLSPVSISMFRFQLE